MSKKIGQVWRPNTKRKFNPMRECPGETVVQRDIPEPTPLGPVAKIVHGGLCGGSRKKHK
jgi:hypothetical protein